MRGNRIMRPHNISVIRNTGSKARRDQAKARRKKKQAKKRRKGRRE